MKSRICWTSLNYPLVSSKMIHYAGLSFVYCQIPPMAALTMHGLISDMRILFTSIELQSMKNTEIKE